MTGLALRTRAQYLQFLERKLSETTNEVVRTALDAAVRVAVDHDRSISPLATLSRVVEACDAIESGEAALLAREMRQSEGTLRPSRTPINASTVDAYIQLRRARDERDRRATEWTGPRRESLSPARSPRLASYLSARRDAMNARRPLAVRSRARRIDEIIGSLPAAEDRQDVRFELDKGYIAQRELALLKKAIETNFPGVALGRLMQDANRARSATSDSPCRMSEEQRALLAQLRHKIKNPDMLRRFGLTTDGARLKTLHTGAHFMEKGEYEALLALLDGALAS